MKVLVTGGTGFAGSHTVRALRASGHTVRLLVRDAAKAARLFPGADAPEEVVVGDVTDADAVGAALDGVEAVFHAAAIVALESARAREVVETNTRGVRNVLGGAVARGLGSIVYVSSAGALYQPGSARIHAEMDVAPARSAYARSKAECERFARALQAEGAAVRISYPCGVLGPDDPGMSEANHALYTFYRDAFLVTEGGFQIVDVRDLARFHVRLLEFEGGAQRAVVAGEHMSWRDFGDLLDALTGAPLRRIPVPGPLLRVAGRVGDVVKRVYDFNFPLTLEATDFATRWPGADGEPAARALGLAYRPTAETLTDTLRWMLRAGHLGAAQIGKLAEPSASG